MKFIARFAVVIALLVTFGIALNKISSGAKAPVKSATSVEGKAILNKPTKTKPKLSGEIQTSCNCNDDLPCTDDACVDGRCAFNVKPGFCVINGICYSNGQRNPNKQCQACRPASSKSYWTNDDALQCSDGQPCTKDDRCRNGECRSTTYTCNDGKNCTTDRCDGQGGCANEINQGHCLIAGTCYSRGQANPANQCDICRDDWGEYYKTHWSKLDTGNCPGNSR